MNTKRTVRSVAIVSGLLGSIDSPRGGVAAHIRTLAIELSRRGLDVQIAVLETEAEIARIGNDEQIDGTAIQIHRIPLRDGKLLGFRALSQRDLTKFVSSLDVDLVHVHGSPELVRARRIKEPTVFTLHGLPWAEGSGLRRLVRQLRRLTYKSALRAYSGMIQVTAVEVGAHPLIRSVIPNPISAAYTDIPGWVFDPLRVPTIISVGAICERKQQSKVAAIMARSDTTSRLLLVGECTDNEVNRVREELNSSDSVELVLLGGLDPSDVAAALVDASAFALLSTQETDPIAVQEALATGIPCILSEAADPLGIAGQLAGVERPATVDAEGLSSFLSDPDLNHSTDARRSVARARTASIVTDQTVEMYHRCCQQSPLTQAVR